MELIKIKETFRVRRKNKTPELYEKRKRQNNKRRRLHKQLDRIVDEKETGNVLQNVVKRISDYFKSPSKTNGFVT